MTAHASFTAFVEQLSGMEIMHVWRGYGSALFLELGNLTPTVKRDGTPGNPEGQITIGIEWSWRIEDPTSIVCGSWSDDAIWEASFDYLRHGFVANLSLFGRLPEIELTLAGGHRLLSFSTTDGQPEWYIIDRRSTPKRSFYVQEGSLHEGDGTEAAT